MVLVLGACGSKTVISKPDASVAGTSSPSTTSASTTTATSEATTTSTTTAPKPTTTTLPATTTTTVPAGIGSTITLTGRKSKLAVTVTKMTDPFDRGEFSRPDPGQHLVGVQLRLVNTGTTVWSDSISNGAKLVDAAKQEYESTTALARPRL